MDFDDVETLAGAAQDPRPGGLRLGADPSADEGPMFRWARNQRRESDDPRDCCTRDAAPYTYPSDLPPPRRRED
jgi:hypothetical protein